MRSRWTLSRVMLTALFAASTLSAFPLSVAAQDPPEDLPEVFHSPTLDGQPPSTTPFSLPLMGSNDLDLWIETGATATAVTEFQKICANGRLGHELCGWQIEIVTTGAITIDDFNPETGLPGPPIQYFKLDDNTIRINRVNADAALQPPGDFGTLRIGTLTVIRAGAGEVQLSSDSMAIGASLQSLTVEGSPIAVPEPGWLWLVGAGVLFLVLASRHRARALRSGVAAFVLAGVTAPAEAQIYLDQTAFQNALGASTVTVQDFESVPLDGNGDAAFGNGQDFGGFTVTSLIVTSPVTLWNEIGVATSLTGTMLVEDMSSRWNSVAVSPGGSPFLVAPESDDDFKIDFQAPVRAAGLMIADNWTDAGESVEFRDDQDQTLASVTLGEGDVFYGYVSPSPAPLIASIVVNEGAGGDSQGDDIYFDDVTWAAEIVLPDPPEITPQALIQGWKQYSKNTPGLPLFPNGLGSNQFFGSSVAGIGDLNGDSVPDAVIGEPYVNDGAVDLSGRIWILFLERDGDIRSVQRISNTHGELSGPGNPGAYLTWRVNFGASVTALGNLDGDPDGTVDLAVGGTQYLAGSGIVYILFMRSNGSVERVQRISATEGASGGGGLGALLTTNDLFGTDVALVGDLDQDGRPELAVGAGTVWDTGSVYLLSLNADGTFDLMRKLDNSDSSLAAHLTLQIQDSFGAGVAAVGDLDLDGIADLAVSSPGSDVSGSNRGAVHILFLNSDGSVKGVAPIQWPSSLSFGGLNWFGGDADYFGSSLQWIPTPNAPTPGILAVGMQGFDPISPFFGSADEGDGAVVFLTLDNAGAAVATGQVFRTRSSQFYTTGLFDPTLFEAKHLGRAIGYLGDLDDNGAPDIMVGAALAAVDGWTNVGAAYLFPLSGLDAIAFADAVAGTSGPISSAQDIVGWPDFAKSGAVIYDGSSITVQFVDNFAFTGGDEGTDVIIHRDTDYAFGASDLETIKVWASLDGQTFVPVHDDDHLAEIGGIPVDLHYVTGPGTPSGLSSTDQIRFLKIEVTSSNCVYSPPFPCSPLIPRYLAVEAVSNRNLATDTDYDGIKDGVDNCLNIRNPNQGDGDGDGWGDYCDVCPEDPNPDQDFVCIAPVIELKGPYAATNPTTQAEWHVSIKGGSAPTLFANVGILAPSDADPNDMDFGTTTGSIGAGCDKPPAGEAVGVGVGVGCATANLSVNAATSGMLRPADTGGLGLRDDAVYLALDAADGVNGFAGRDQKALMGKLVVNYDAPRLIKDLRSPSWWGSGFAWLPVIDPEPRYRNVGDDKYEGRFKPTIEFDIVPATPVDTFNYAWQVCVKSEQHVHRLTFDIIADDQDDTIGNLRWRGCEFVTGQPYNKRSCSGTIAATVSAADSNTWGPLANDEFLSVQLEGSEVLNTNGIRTLNPDITSSVCIGTVDSVHSAEPSIAQASEGVASTPLIVMALDGNTNSVPDELLVCESEPGTAPCDPGLPSTCGLSCYLDTHCESGQECVFSWSPVAFASAADFDDFDDDFIRDESDNCPYYHNDQSNSGGTTLGDACECGDMDYSGDFEPLSNDLAIMRDVALKKITDPQVTAHCSVEGGGDCTIRDAVYFQAAETGSIFVSLSAACDDANPPPVTTAP